MSPSGSAAGLWGPLVLLAIKGTDSCHSASAQTAHVGCGVGANCLTCPTASWSICRAGSPATQCSRVLAIRWYCTSTNHRNATSSADAIGAQTTGGHRHALATRASDQALPGARGTWPGRQSLERLKCDKFSGRKRCRYFSSQWEWHVKMAMSYMQRGKCLFVLHTTLNKILGRFQQMHRCLDWRIGMSL